MSRVRRLVRAIILVAATLAVGLLAYRGLTPYYWPAPPRPDPATLPAPNPGPWYKGDLHAHSLFSDGMETVGAHLARAEALDLDFYCITDHDNWLFSRGVPRQWSSPQYTSDRVTLLFGEEWTTPNGHASIWASHPFDYSRLWQDNQRRDPDAAMAHAHEQGAIFSINHPNDTVHWRYPIDVPPDTMEVWHCRFHMPRFSGHRVWDPLLRSGHMVPGVGGSDVYALHQVPLLDWRSESKAMARPTTWVYADSKDPETLLRAIRQGHVSISYAPDGPRLEFSADIDGHGVFDAMMGDSMKVQETPVRLKVRIVDPAASPNTGGVSLLVFDENDVEALVKETLTPADIESRMARQGLSRFDLLLVYKDGVVSRLVTLPPGLDTYEFSETPNRQTYYRAELLRIPTPNLGRAGRYKYGVTAMTNPVYFRPR